MFGKKPVALLEKTKENLKKKSKTNFNSLKIRNLYFANCSEILFNFIDKKYFVIIGSIWIKNLIYCVNILKITILARITCINKWKLQ